MKNIFVIIVLLVVAAAGVYFYIQRDAANLVLGGAVPASESVLANTQVFMQRRAQLEQLSIDGTLFTDPRFRSLRSFTTPVPERPIGRDNPFLPAERVEP